MHKKIITVIIAILVTSFLVVPAMAKGPSKQAGKSNIGHLYLYEKMPAPGDETRKLPWLIVEGGMWGKMKYNLSGLTFDFVFNGHSLPIGQEYALIYYPDPWPANGLICLGSGIVTACETVEIEAGVYEEICSEDGTGNVHIQGSVDTGTLPNDIIDANSGAKIFLVPSGDVDCENQVMTGWSGDDANLYEGALINFIYTDGTVE
jgi:hypothetical protein